MMSANQKNGWLKKTIRCVEKKMARKNNHLEPDLANITSNQGFQILARIIAENFISQQKKEVNEDCGKSDIEKKNC